MNRSIHTALVGAALSLLLLPAAAQLGPSPASAIGPAASPKYIKALPVDPIQLTDLSCPTPMICTAVGIDAKDNAAVFRTSNGGTTWVAQTIAAGTPFPYTVSCPTTSFCLAMGVGGIHPDFPAFVETANGGSQWNTYPEPVNLGNAVFNQTMCASPTNCYIVQSEVVFRSTDLGVTWKPLSRHGWKGIQLLECVRASDCLVIGTTDGGALEFGRIAPNAPSVALVARVAQPKGFVPRFMSCSSPTSCAVIGATGTSMLTTSDGGTTWSLRRLPVSVMAVGAFSCPDAKVCVVPSVSSRHKGVLLAATTRNDGVTWSVSGVVSTPSPTAQRNIGVSGISCPSASVCFVSGPAQRPDSVFVREGFTSRWIQEIVK